MFSQNDIMNAVSGSGGGGRGGPVSGGGGGGQPVSNPGGQGSSDAPTSPELPMQQGQVNPVYQMNQRIEYLKQRIRQLAQALDSAKRQGMAGTAEQLALQYAQQELEQLMVQKFQNDQEQLSMAGQGNLVSPGMRAGSSGGGYGGDRGDPLARFRPGVETGTMRAGQRG